MSFDASKYTKSKWLKGSDLTPGQQVRVTVKAAYEHEFEQQHETKPVLDFHELDQSLPLNKTQTATMINNFGPNAALWIGQALLLMQTPSNYVGKPTILIMAAPPATPGASAHGIAPQVPNGDVIFGKQ